MLIRDFEPGDADAVATLFHTSVRQAGILDYSPEQVAAWSPAKPDPERFARVATERTFLVAVDHDGTIAGYGDLEPNGHIDHLYCHPDKIGTGVGSAIFAALEAAAITAGIKTLFVEASEGSRRLFERRGFLIEGREEIERDGVALHFYRMTKQLG